MAGNYWDSVGQRRISRRRVIVGAGAAGASAAFLAACGGGDDDGGSDQPEDKSGLLYVRKDESKEAKKGGLYTDAHPLVLTTLDPMFPGGHIRVARRGYSQLFRVTDGVLQSTPGTIDGDAGESWELSPDKLTLTVKLDQRAKYPAIPPVNGRVVDSADVLFTWNRLLEKGNLRGEISNKVNAASPVLNIEAPDAKTIVIKMAQPDVTIFPLLATEVLGGMYILPKEAADEKVIDIQRQAIGTGPYYLTENSEVNYRWKRNPNFGRAKLTNGEPYIDEIWEPVITDTAAGGAQFRAGKLLEYNLPATEVIGAKKENMDLLMRAVPPSTFTERLYFGTAPDSPFKDDRVRRAFMKTIDRDAFLDAAYNVDKYAAEGLPVSAFWEASLRQPTYSGWWLDPKEPKNWGADANNYVFSIEEARKLLEAAAVKTPLEFSNTYGAPAPTSFPATYYTRAEIFLGMIEGSGIFKQNRVLIDYRTEWNSPKFRFSGGNFVGTTWGPDTSAPEPTSAMFFIYNSKGGYFLGGDSTLDDLTAKAKLEFDENKRKDLIHQIQKHDAKMMYNEKIGIAGTFALNWPALRNVGVYQGGTNWLDITTPSALHAWLDQTKRPFV
jgi:ABC-type transport system substrate-binding protein